MTDLIDRYKQMAAGGSQFHGLTVLDHVKSIGRLARAVGATSMLDYGCGRGDAYRSPHKLHHQLGIKRANVRLYDPSFPAHSEFPLGDWDLVICSDVLEHVPEDEVDWLLGTLFRCARKAVWMSVCCRPAKKTFPGTDINLHVTVRPFDWWKEKVEAMWRAEMSPEGGEARQIDYNLVETK